MFQLPSPDLPHAPQDSVLVESPLPGGVATLVRFLFQVPQWVQIAGVVLGAAIVLWLVARVWRRRWVLVLPWDEMQKEVRFLGWMATRSRAAKITLALVVLVALVGAAGAGAASWNYMQHDNGFCTGCHVMGQAYQRFTASEHDTLSCHDCHQQSIYASTRQLYLWVLERPEDIAEHSKVPNVRCETCHVTDQAETWQRIATTAGHRTHLESDSSALDSIQCVTCHGLEVHSFVPVDSTCAQADCHVNQRIALGPMAEQTALHCANCHEFTIDVPLLATRDSAAGTLVPRRDQCFSCHEMQEVLAEFDVARDPHGGTCGMCHNPHEQETAQDAGESCATAACHADWRVEPFHVGTNHGRIGSECLTCHTPHRANVDASDCAACHRAVFERDDIPRAMRDRLRRALPFDTAAAARQIGGRPGPEQPGWVHVSIREPPARAKGDGPPVAAAVPHAFARPPAARQDTFPHAPHEDLTCITCHTTREGRDGLVFEQPRGCQLCHHQDGTRADCAQCHVDGGPDEPQAVRVAVTVASRGAATHAVEFGHAAHDGVACAQCHVGGAALDVAPAVAECRDCHDDHHTAERACAQCHVAAGAPAAHGPPAEAHTGCDACHQAATVQRLMPDRPLCASCHESQATDHYAERECTTCHMLAEPGSWRRHLARGAAR